MDSNGFSKEAFAKVKKKPKTQEIEGQFRKLTSKNSEAQSAFESLYDFYAPTFFGMLRARRFSSQDAQDIVQETFLKLASHASTVAQKTYPKAYLSKIFTNCMVDCIRKSEKIRNMKETISNEQIANALIGAQPPPPREGLVECFEAAFRTFEEAEPERALVLRLGAILQYNRKEIAEVIGRTARASGQFLYSSRKQFQQILKNRCTDYFVRNDQEATK